MIILYSLNFSEVEFLLKITLFEKLIFCLWIDLTTRAVHIEITPSLSTDIMIMALRRFAARRGMTKIIYTDNGTNFVGANEKLKRGIVHNEARRPLLRREDMRAVEVHSLLGRQT